MTSRHRPLSTWVARVSPSGLLGPVNDGRERADARTFSWFESDWTRARLPAARAGRAAQTALALVEDGTGAVVAELDNYGRPLPVSGAGLAVIAAVERQWPSVDGGAGWTALAAESLQLRHLLLRRLVTESAAPPPAGLFHILDWHLVADLAVQLTRRTAGENPDGPRIALRHWFAPAVRGLTAGLEQLDAGHRAGRPDARHQGTQGLLAALETADVLRIPEPTRFALADLLAAIADAQPMYASAARARSRALTGLPDGDELLRIALEPELLLRGSEGDREQQTDIVGEPGFTLSVTRSALGQLMISASVTAGDPSALPLFLSVEVRLPEAPAEDRSYWIALRHEDERLTGTLVLPLPRFTFVVSAADLPVGAAALRFADPAVLLRSIRVSDFDTATAWSEAAEDLPDGHAVRTAAIRFREEL